MPVHLFASRRCLSFVSLSLVALWRITPGVYAQDCMPYLNEAVSASHQGTDGMLFTLLEEVLRKLASPEGSGIPPPLAEQLAETVLFLCAKANEHSASIQLTQFQVSKAADGRSLSVVHSCTMLSHAHSSQDWQRPCLLCADSHSHVDDHSSVEQANDKSFQWTWRGLDSQGAGVALRGLAAPVRCTFQCVLPIIARVHPGDLASSGSLHPLVVAP